MMIVNDDSRVVNKFEASLTDNARVIIYDCHMFIVQATGVLFFSQGKLIWIARLQIAKLAVAHVNDP
jgi:hypothetical protein